MNKSWKLISITLVCYVVFMLILAPAAWWLKLVSLPAGVQLGNVSGTLSSGKVSGIQIQKLYLSDLSWQLNPWQLITGKAQFAITSGNGQQVQFPYVKSTLNYSLFGLSLQDSLFRLQAVDVMPLLDMPVPIEVTGEVVLDIADYKQGEPVCDSLKGNVSWLDAKLLTLSGNWLDLQSLFATLGCDDGSLVMQTAPDNILGLDAAFRFNSERVQLDGTVQPASSLPEEVHQAMAVLGRPDGNGRYTLKL
ncbi:type II secretion system protein N [Rheinheimera sp. WS51]|uniref:type II secretion system protein N n=1 Tax=Rheinheimera sp. WS51 TaxID=3425886 RepID=UPI003D8E1BF9